MKGKKKYIVFTPFFPSDSSHIGSYIYDQVQALKRIGSYEIIIVKLVPYYSFEKDYSFKNITVKIFRVLDFPFFILPSFFNSINKFRIRRFIRENKLLDNIYILHGHVSYPSAYLINSVASNINVKTIIQHHGLDVLQLLNGRNQFTRFINRHFLFKRSIRELNKIDLNVSVSQKVRLELHKYKEYKPKDEFVLYNGVDTNKFYDTGRSMSDLEYFKIGCVANFWPIKDQMTLIKAVELLIKDGISDVKLQLIGVGQTLNECKRYVEENKLADFISFYPQRSHEKLNEFYNDLNLFVLPSYYEALGCVLLEAWATNTVIISVDDQGISELLPESEKKNLLFERKSPISLKEKIYMEYSKKRIFHFNDKYDINNLIKQFLNYSFFN